MILIFGSRMHYIENRYIFMKPHAKVEKFNGSINKSCNQRFLRNFFNNLCLLGIASEIYNINK